jgi:hypothetical protein
MVIDSRHDSTSATEPIEHHGEIDKAARAGAGSRRCHG